MFEKPLRPEDGGTERLSDTIMRGLEKRGYHCMGFLVLRKTDDRIYYQQEPVADLRAFLSEHDIDIVINQLGYSAWLLEKFYRLGGSQWKAEGGKVVTCLHFDPRFPTFFPARIAWKEGPAKAIGSMLRLPLIPYLRYRERRDHAETFRHLYRASDRFGMLSETHYPYFKKLTGLKDYDKLFAIFNPLTFDDISDQSIIEQKEKTVLVVARLSEYHKRISIVLKAWKTIGRFPLSDGWRLEIVGDGPDASLYKRFVEENGLKNVTFHGQCDPEPFYTKASLFLLTSSAEGWGLTLTESLQRGVVPVVMESSPVFREILSDGKTGFLVKEGDRKGLVGKTIELIRNETLRKQMAINCLHRASLFTTNKALDSWETELNRMDNGREQ